MIKQFENFNSLENAKNLFIECFTEIEDKYNEISIMKSDDYDTDDEIIFILDLGKTEIDASIVAFDPKQAKSNLEMMIDINDCIIKFNNLIETGKLSIKEVQDDTEDEDDLYLSFEGDCGIILLYSIEN